MAEGNYLPSITRPATELVSAATWLGVCLYSIYSINYSDLPPMPFYYLAIVSGLFFLVRIRKAIVNLYIRARLFGRPLKFISPQYLINKIKGNPGKLWLGWGFDWTPEHSQQAFQIEKVEERTWMPPSYVSWFFSKFGLVNPPFGSEKSNRPNGKLWMHGLDNESDLFIPLNDLQGHTLIVGTTGSGKTRLYESLVTSAIRRGEAVIVIDPKGDQELRERIQTECKRAGREDSFAYFHPAHPMSSVRIDPLMNWNRSSEIASRIIALLGGEAGGDAFISFSWRAVNTIASGLIMSSKRPTIANIKFNIGSGPNDLLLQCLEVYFNDHNLDWKDDVREYEIKAQRGEFKKPEKSTPKELVARVQYYKDKTSGALSNNVIDELIELYEHARDHFSKMVAGLLPILSQLDSGDLGDLISPKVDENDMRPILDSAKIINQKMVLYLGLDALADSKVATAIGSIFLADLTAVAADRYNFGVDENTKISLFVDEAAEVVSTEFLQLLNKSRGAGFSVYFASQTIADFEARLGNAAKAMQLLGNANNVIALRVKDTQTLEFVSEKFGNTIIKQIMLQQSTNAVSGDRDVTNYTGSYGERLNEVEMPLIAPDMIANLPNLEYFASLSAGRIIKGRLPLFESEKMPKFTDQFWLKRDV